MNTKITTNDEIADIIEKKRPKSPAEAKRSSRSKGSFESQFGYSGR